MPKYDRRLLSRRSIHTGGKPKIFMCIVWIFGRELTPCSAVFTEHAFKGEFSTPRGLDSPLWKEEIPTY